MSCVSNPELRLNVAVAAHITPRVPGSRSFAACRQKGIQPRVRQQAVTFVSAVCSTNRRIVCEAAGRRDTRAALKIDRLTSRTGSRYSIHVLQQGASMSMHSCLIYKC